MEQQLRESEEKYRQVFENATFGIFRARPDGTLLDVNPALVAMLGYNSKEELLTRNLPRDIYEDPSARKAIIDKYRPSERVDGVEATWKRKDGKVIAVRMSGGAIREGEGSFSHFEVIVEDLTKRRNLEEQFRQAQKMEAVGLLAGGIAHDFNNLLSVILGNAELLLETGPSGAQQRYAEQIRDASSRSAQLISQLLAISRKQILHSTVLNLNRIIQDVGSILQHLIGEDVQIVNELGTGLASIRADRGQIEQILMNLATNARDAMPNGGQLTIRTSNADLGPDDAVRYPYVQPGRYIRLAVSDTGVGMSEEVRVRALEPFFTTKPPGRGTGLGLSTVYGILKQSGGYIWISSAPGAGATFDIYLPRVDEPAPPLAADLDVRTVHPTITATILLLEDETSVRQVMYEFLTTRGYNVLQAGRGDDAIDLAEQFTGSISLIVSDIVLPDTKGPSAVTKIQALHPEANVLYVTGYAAAPLVQQLVSQGAVIMQKPVSGRALLKKVNEMLRLGGSLGS
jgi:PAS domain S-box-containing protein